MVSVTFSPPSDWTLMGSISGLDMRMGVWSVQESSAGVS